MFNLLDSQVPLTSSRTARQHLSLNWEVCARSIVALSLLFKYATLRLFSFKDVTKPIVDVIKAILVPNNIRIVKFSTMTKI